MQPRTSSLDERTSSLLRFPLVSPWPRFSVCDSQNGRVFSKLLSLRIPVRSQHTRIPNPRLFKIAHSPTFAVTPSRPDAHRGSPTRSSPHTGTVSNCTDFLSEPF